MKIIQIRDPIPNIMDNQKLYFFLYIFKKRFKYIICIKIAVYQLNSILDVIRTLRKKASPSTKGIKK